MLRVSDVAKRLDINPETVRIWLRTGKLRGTRPGGDKMGWRIPESEVQRILSGGASADGTEHSSARTGEE
jgi:excisionase family DNA binding protein